MRAVAAEAAASELTMLGVSFGRVAAGTGDGCGRAGVWLMALQALGMADRRSPGLLRMAAFARCCARTAVWFVAIGTFSVSGDYGMLFRRVTRGAAGLGHRVVWQTLVTTAAVFVTWTLADGAELLCVATIAQTPVGFGQRKLMRLVTLGASHGSVKVLIAVSVLVAAAAGSRHLSNVTRGRVRVVATNAAARGAELGVIGVHVLMAIHAGLFGAAAHVVRSVAANAGGVRRHRGRGQDVNFSVARTTRQRGLLAERVRLVTAHALGVAVGKQRSLWHERLLGGVARLARRERVDRRSVLVLVTRRADLLRCLTNRRVIGLDVTVAARARSGLGSRVLVNMVATHAIGPAVHDYRGGISLRSSVTADAVLRLEVGVRRRAACGVTGVSLDFRRRKFMTIGTIRLGRVTEALGCLGGGVPQLALRFMARGAACRCGLANGVAVQLVALRAGQLVLNDVDLVTGRRARALPSQLHVQRGRRLARIQARSQGRQHDHERGCEQRTKRWRHPPSAQHICSEWSEAPELTRRNCVWQPRYAQKLRAPLAPQAIST